MPSSEQMQKIDHAALRTNQGAIITLNVLAFILNLPLLALLVAVVMLVGSLVGKPGFGFLYRWALKPLGLVKPDVIEDHIEPHRFAQTFGSVVLHVGAFALFIGASGLGWGLVWLVVALAALNLFGGFCMGCALYYWLNRMHVPGFVKAPPPGTSPGRRPRESTK